MDVARQPGAADGFTCQADEIPKENPHTPMTRRKFHQALSAAVAGIAAGVALQPELAHGQAKGEKHVCKGMNDCKGQGGCAVAGKHDCAGKNECKGQGGCATVAKHDCAGKNECKGQGGCAVAGKHDCAGKNDCKGQGGCAVPLKKT